MKMKTRTRHMMQLYQPPYVLKEMNPYTVCVMIFCNVYPRSSYKTSCKCILETHNYKIKSLFPPFPPFFMSLLFIAVLILDSLEWWWLWHPSIFRRQWKEVKWALSQSYRNYPSALRLFKVLVCFPIKTFVKIFRYYSEPFQTEYVYIGWKQNPLSEFSN